jgi:inner membrane protein
VDSITQLTAGAAVGEAVLGRKVGRKAMLWGAVLGTLPDLDVLIPVDGPVEAFVYHRGFSHSLFLLALVSPLAGWGITKIHPATRKHFKGWVLLALLVLQSGVLLDFLTVYGTRILWPFVNTPLAWPVFFIVDPLFTIPLLAGCLAALLLSRDKHLGHRLNTVGMMLGLVYMLWAFGVREFSDHRVKEQLARQNVDFSRLVSTPAPFTTFLYRFVGMDGDTYFETYFSIFDGDAPLSVNTYPRNVEMLRGLDEHPPVVNLRWFTRGWYAAAREGNSVVISDLRMGSEPYYVFRFKVATVEGPDILPVKDEQLETQIDPRQLSWVWKRIWQPIPVPSWASNSAGVHN